MSENLSLSVEWLATCPQTTNGTGGFDASYGPKLPVSSWPVLGTQDQETDRLQWGARKQLLNV